MASRAVGGASRTLGGGATDTPDWKATLRRSLVRAAELAGSLLLFALMLFLGLALASYTQTDPSASTAAGGAVANWMGAPGAWAAERMLFVFGPASALLLPLIYFEARRLWVLADDEDGTSGPGPAPRWWRLLALLALTMTLIGTVLALTFDAPGGTLPASMGGLAGLFGAKAIGALAGLLPPPAQGWTILGLALVCLGGAAVLAGRVFPLEWRALLRASTRASKLSRARTRAETGPRVLEAPAPLARRKPGALARAAPDFTAEPAPEALRRAPEISDPRTPPKQAQLSAKSRQTDLFDQYELPGLALLNEPPAHAAPKLDKLALERNARLLENVLDDFNVKGEITAVRTGPVVTMYELEPAPGIKASRVIGLAEDIARNMSAISARVSSIPGRTVMGIELPNVDRQTVAFRELASCDAFVGSKALLPIILGKDIAGGPIVADLAAMPHLLVAGTTGSGKSVGLNTILLSLLYRLTPEQLRMILIDPKVLELKSYDDIPHLLSPVVTEPAKAVRALKWAVEEMERRYRMMSSIGVRNLSGFNEKLRAAQAKGKPLGRRIQVGFDPDSGEERFEEQQLDYKVLPQIVVIVDELADLTTCFTGGISNL